MTEDAIRGRLAALRNDETVNLSPSTRRVYGIHWRDFAAWCEANRHDPLPCTDTVVVGYLMDRYDRGTAITTLKSIRNAIASKHALAGFDRPTISDDVKTCLRLLRRKAATEGRATQKQAPGIRLEHIEQLEGYKPDWGQTWGTPGEPPIRWTKADERRHAKNCALVSTMHSALLRCAEAANLRWGDIVFLANGQGRLTIRKSKTSDVPMPPRLLTTRAVGHLRSIMPKDPDMDARVFGVKAPRSIHKRIQRAMKDIRPGATGHSPRVGGAQDMTIRGASLHQVKEAGGWKSLMMPAHYASAVKAERGAVNLLED